MSTITQHFRVPRLESIRSRILALAVLGTFIPAALTLGIAYEMNRRAVEEKITQELLSQSAQTARAAGVWLKEQLYDLRVFASSDEVSVNLERFSRGTADARSTGRLRDYLRSLHERFRDFEQLMVLDLQGRVVGSSALDPARVNLPSEWVRLLRSESQVVGEPYWDPVARKGKLVVAVPVQGGGGRLLGAFAAELNLTPVQALLRSFAHDTVGVVYLATAEGQMIASSRGVSPQLLQQSITSATLDRLARQGSESALEYASLSDEDVLGALEPVPQVQWIVVAELPTGAAYGQVRRFRNFALIVVLALLLIVSASAYRLGVLIVRPLDRLTKGAAEVAAGDLAVDLPEAGRGEVGYLTSVFNHMVERLREGRAELDAMNEALRKKNKELERLSVTDGLTGLANHRSLMQRLYDEGLRSRRNKQPFVLLMADVDHFKAFNDAFGHPAGDEVLKRVAMILRDSTRTVDCAARYGGEEFAVLLPETSVEGALQVAERIRATVESTDFPERPITLSIGVAEFPADAESPQGVVTAADEALYEAKRAGRNRVAQARRMKVRRKKA